MCDVCFCWSFWIWYLTQIISLIKWIYPVNFTKIVRFSSCSSNGHKYHKNSTEKHLHFNLFKRRNYFALRYFNAWSIKSITSVEWSFECIDNNKIASIKDVRVLWFFERTYLRHLFTLYTYDVCHPLWSMIPHSIEKSKTFFVDVR